MANVVEVAVLQGGQGGPGQLFYGLVAAQLGGFGALGALFVAGGRVEWRKSLAVRLQLVEVVGLSSIV